jgi:MFS family permease
MTNRRILYAAAFIRAVATGMIGVLAGVYLAKIGLSASQIGLVIGAGLVGAAASSLVVTCFGDRLGRRRALIVLALLAGLGGLLFTQSAGPFAAGAGAFIGMLNGMGRDRGAALILETAALPATATDAARTQTFAWYSVAQDVGHALGGLAAASPAIWRYAGIDEITSYRLTLYSYAALMLATAPLYARMTGATEAGASGPRLAIAPETRVVLRRISVLFGVDSLAGGFLGTALLSYFFFTRFGASPAVIAVLFFAARTANALSHLAAAWLARRIGLVNTMVFTHIPSSLLLIAVAFAPSFWIAAALFLARETLVEMDVPTRQSYVMAVVRPEERTFASGMTNLVRLGGWAVAPFAAGFLMQGVALATPLFLGAGIKIVYDLLLWRAFYDAKPPEERARG